MIMVGGKVGLLQRKIFIRRRAGVHKVGNVY